MENLFTDFGLESPPDPGIIAAESPYPLVLTDFTDGTLVPSPELETTAFKSPIYDGTQPVWPSLLTFELALGINSLETILGKYGLSEGDYEYLKNLPAFHKEILDHTVNIQKNGLTFRIKSAAQAEAYLEELDGIVRNHQNPVSTRLDAIKCAVKWGDLEPKEDKKDSAQQGQMFNIQINF